MHNADDSERPRPDVFRMDLAEVSEKPFPRPQSEYRIVLEKDAHDAVAAHGATDRESELCGVLVGDLYQDADGPFLLITDIVRARDARQESTQVTFTHSAWEHINKEMDDKHADKRIVGWYHMHPGFGVFLSEVDLFAHKNFFNAPWQVSLVMDQKARKVGLFYWQNEEVVRARRYWIGKDVQYDAATPPTRLPEPGKRARNEPADDEPDRDEPVWPSLNTSILVLLGLLGLLAIFMAFRAASGTERLARELHDLRVRSLEQRQSEAAQLAFSLALWARKQLDDGAAPETVRPVYEKILKLAPAHTDAYEKLLPELAGSPAAGDRAEDASAKESGKSAAHK